MQRRLDSDTHVLVHILQGVLHNTPTQLDSNLQGVFCEGYFIVPCERHPGVEVLFVLIIHPGLYYTPVVAFFKIRLNSRQNEIEMKLN